MVSDIQTDPVAAKVSINLRQDAHQQFSKFPLSLNGFEAWISEETEILQFIFIRGLWLDSLRQTPFGQHRLSDSQ